MFKQIYFPYPLPPGIKWQIFCHRKAAFFHQNEMYACRILIVFFLYIDEAVRQINFWTWAGSENQHTNIKAVIIHIRNNLVPLEMRNRETMLGSFISKS